MGLTSLPDVHVDEAISILQKIDNPEKLSTMKKNTEILAKKHSTENICKILLED